MTRKELHRFYEKLRKYVWSNPGSGGIELLEEFETMLFDNDLFIGSKKRLKDLAVCRLDSGDFYMNQHTRIVTSLSFYKFFSQGEIKAFGLETEDLVRICKEEFVAALENPDAYEKGLGGDEK
jgi:hypothetical protein